ncbi:hypothetical protein [Methylobacterium segetis]|uniref:hypothetical protein n=1 Tax=Methylobacterium segetis TaxID=2488750 RepID=UPI001048A4D4|nr:hypothetical protein [Methylobacterium segetis]
MTMSLRKVAEFEGSAALEGVSDSDIHFSRLSGMSPQDIEHLRIFTINEGLLVVIRCPKRPARFHHGKYQPKTMETGITYEGLKSGEDGLVRRPDGRIQVSDYDLMCVYRIVEPGSYEKVFFSGTDPTNKRSALTPEATSLLRKVNAGLKSRFQHGAQDDYQSAANPGVKHSVGGSRPDRFAAFDVGTVSFLCDPRAAQEFYAKRGLAWPYGDSGRFEGAG